MQITHSNPRIVRSSKRTDPSAARKADPNAVLYINDYNLDSVNSKLNGLVSLVNRVNSANPGTVDGIGSQAHLQSGQGSSAKAALTALAAANVKEVAITELDIVGASANDYTAVVNACLSTRGLALSSPVNVPRYPWILYYSPRLGL
ncbi:hypothetical protein NMY22_g7517 [Coprinellus aureogranulatus]|nr:hypothetical protein NMY22_g7517 [Coprinellus aureogranulatus]